MINYTVVPVVLSKKGRLPSFFYFLSSVQKCELLVRSGRSLASIEKKYSN